MSRYKQASWKRLDNAAKIFPPNSNNYDTKVFRFSCRLKKEVQPDKLELALSYTIQCFPLYRSIIRKGLFWYYFETSTIKPKVTEEKQGVCSALYNENIKGLLFRVTYYRNRINVEVHHALADGVGALQFLKTLVTYYLKESYQEKLSDKNIQPDDLSSVVEKEIDGFKQYSHQATALKKQHIKKVYKLKEEKNPDHFLQVINGIVPVSKVISKAHQYDTTLTIYLCALLIKAIESQMSMRDKEKAIVVSIPVNLRQYFKSASARNFFSVVAVPYKCKEKEEPLEVIIKELKDFFNKEFKEEKFKQKINHLVSLEKNYVTRAIPLILKKPTLQIAHTLNSREVTTSFSNVGRVTVQKELEPYIEGFDFCVSTTKIQVCMCSFKEQLSISFTSPFITTEVQKYFFRALSSEGIEVTISSNLIGDGSRNEVLQ